MQTTVKVSKPEEYDIVIENGACDRIAEIISDAVKGKACLIVSDSNVAPLYLDHIKDQLTSAGYLADTFVFEAGEQSKTLSTVGDILGAMCDAGLTRSDFAVALGGGVCGDLTGFAAAVYQRGIDYIGIPTTLLSQIDSSVGGKTGCDLPAGKNLAGAFHSPKAVIIDPLVLNTLPQKIWNDGMGEAIKYGVIKSKPLFDRIMNEDAHDFMPELITECVSIKRDVVENDFHDLGERVLLNFGHTIGHAIEKYYNYKNITHGEAVGIGMVMMAAAAERNGDCEAGTAEKISDCLHKYSLPATTSIDKKTLCKNAMNDKKRSGDSIKIVIPSCIGTSTAKMIPADMLFNYLGGEE